MTRTRCCGSMLAWKDLVACTLVSVSMVACVEPDIGPRAATLDDSTIGRTTSKLEAVLHAIDAVGPQAQQEYKLSLARLKADPRATDATLGQLGRAPKTGISRWKLVFVLAGIADPRALPELTAIASASLAKRPLHRLSRGQLKAADPLAEQMMVQRQAVWAIEETAKSSPDAVTALESLINAPEKEVRIAAALALHRLGKISAAVKASMVAMGMTGTIRVRSKRSLLGKIRPSLSKLKKAEQRLQKLRDDVNSGVVKSPLPTATP